MTGRECAAIGSTEEKVQIPSVSQSKFGSSCTYLDRATPRGQALRRACCHKTGHGAFARNLSYKNEGCREIKGRRRESERNSCQQRVMWARTTPYRVVRLRLETTHYTTPSCHPAITRALHQNLGRYTCLRMFWIGKAITLVSSNMAIYIFNTWLLRAALLSPFFY